MQQFELLHPTPIVHGHSGAAGSHLGMLAGCVHINMEEMCQICATSPPQQGWTDGAVAIEDT